MNEGIRDIVNYISIWSIVLPLITGFCLFKKLSRDSLIVLGIVTLGTIPELSCMYYIKDSPPYNISYNLYTPFEFLMLFLLFYNKFSNNPYRLLFRISVAVYITISLFILFAFGISARFVNEWVCVNNIIFTAWTLMLFTDDLNRYDGLKTDFQAPLFWYISAYFFYSPCTLLIYSLWYFFKKNDDPVLNNLRVIHNIFNTALYVFFTIGFIKDVQKAKARDVALKEITDHEHKQPL